jgi:L-malate glycosyltransferase
MRVLHTVQFYHPSVGGMQEVVKQLSERLVKLGHEVTVATSRFPGRIENPLNGVRIVEFDISGNLASRLRGEVETYRRFLLENDFDVITNFAAQQWATDIALPLLDKIRAAKVFVPTGFSGFFSEQYRNYFSAMKSWMHKYDMNVFLSADYRDINFAHDCGVKNITVIPNGAGEEEFLCEPAIDIRALLGIPRDKFLILHVGSHTGLKGHAEAMKIFSMARIRNAILLIIANGFDGCANSCKIRKTFANMRLKWQGGGKQLIMLSLPRMETIAAYREADLFLFPSRLECSPLVLFECMASRTPYLTTDVGNAREIIEWSGGGILLPTTKDASGCVRADVGGSAVLLEDIYGNRKKRQLMQDAGFLAWQERFTWSKIAGAYEDLYRMLVAGMS